MSNIIVQPYKVDPKKMWGYSEELKVVYSDHPRFIAGTRFDEGFNVIAIRQGYQITYLPILDGPNGMVP